MIPNKVQGKNFVKEIDALFSNLKINVDNKTVPGHKEPFIYDENLFVSVGDLSKGLGLGMKVKGKSVNLSSNGKLNSKSRNSNIPIVFQRGYEILAKENIMKSLEDEIQILYGKVPTKTNYSSNYKVRNINVEFTDFSIYLDGNKLNLSVAPIKYKDDIYVALDTIAPYLYVTPSFSKDKSKINIDGNGILTTHSQFSNLSSLLGFREGRNYLLDIQRAELEKRKYIIEELKLPYAKINSINSLKNYLNTNFNKVGDLTVSFDVTQQSGWINLDVSFPSTRNFNWYKLKRSDVEGWIWNIYTSITNLYDEDALISGVIRNPYHKSYSSSSLRNYVTFYTKDLDLYFDFTNSRLSADGKFNPDYLVQVLNKNFNKYSNVSFSYESNISGTDVELLIYPDSNNFNSWSLYSKLGYLRGLNQAIRKIYPDLSVYGKVIYPNEKLSPLDFYISENRVRSVDLLQETTNYLNNHYGSFSYGNNNFKLNYSLSEKDLNDFYLHVDGDFSVNDDKWANAGTGGEQVLSNRIHNAISFIISLWDANVYTEVLDINGAIIKEFDVYQENVSMVHATPSSGEILEGTKVMLYSDTHNSKIYYTTDGSNPTTSSYLYSDPIEITRDLTINAMGYKDGLGTGPMSTFSYTVINDQNLSYGLTALNTSHSSLSPSFSRLTNIYDITIDSDISSITLTPYASSGEIKVGGQVVSSGQGYSVPLSTGKNTVTIAVKESNKKERTYTIRVNKETSENQGNFKMEDLHFNTTFGLIFRGRLSNININTFSGYKIKLLTRSGEDRGQVNLDSNGNFSFPSSEISWFDKIIGFKYEVYDSKGNKVLLDNLN